MGILPPSGKIVRQIERGSDEVEDGGKGDAVTGPKRTKETEILHMYK